MIDKITTGLKTLARSRQLWGYVASAAVLAVLAIAFFHPDAFEGNTLNQGDLQQGAANGREIQLYREATGDQSRWTNALFSGMPTFQISPSYPSDSLFKWIDVAMRAGLPDPSGLLFSMMFGFLIMGACLRWKWQYSLIGAAAWGLSSYFIIIIGAGHLWKFITLTYVPPVIGGVIAAYRGRWLAGSAVAALFAMMQIAANHVQMSYYFMFLIVGIAVAFLIKSIWINDFTKWAKATGALLVAALLAVAANSPSLYNTYKYSKETIRGQHSMLTSGGQAPQQGLDKDYITQYSYGRSESFTLLIPNVKGGASAKPVNGRMQMLTLGQLPQAEKIAGERTLDKMSRQYIDNYVSQYFGEPESTNGPIYVGAIICALFLLGCFIVRGPVKWSFLVLTVLSLLLAMGRNAMWLTDFFIDYVPMYKNFRTPESILVIAEFTMPFLAVLAMAKIFRGEKELKEYWRPVMLAFAIPSFFCLIGWLWPGIYGDAVTPTDYQTSQMLGYQLQMNGYPADVVQYFSIDNPLIYNAVTELRHSMVSADSLRSLLFLAVAFVAIWLFCLKVIPRWVAVSAIGILIIGDLYAADKRYISHESFAPAQPGIADQRFPLTANDQTILADTTLHFRVMDIPNFWNAAPSYHHRTIGGYHAAKLTRYQDIIDNHLSHFTQGQPSKADWNILDMLNARYIVGTDGKLTLNNHALGNAWFVDKIDWVADDNAEMDALDTFNPAKTAVIAESFKDMVTEPARVAPGDTIYLETYAPDRLTYRYRSSGEALAVFSEVYFPWGWIAKVDDRELPIVRADYVLRAMNLPAGEHKLEMSFDPPTVHSTVTWARISIILIYLLAAVALAFTLYGRGKSSSAKS